ncbi:hypothetical protein ACTHGU_05060 [Chitinophagaceae bacterium MMS25-I14]
MSALFLILDFALIAGVALILLVKIWELYFYYVCIPLKCGIVHIVTKPEYTTEDNEVWYEYKLKVQYTSGVRTYEVWRKLVTKNKLEKEPGQEMDIYMHPFLPRVTNLNKGHAGDIGLGIIMFLAILVGLLLIVLYGPIDTTIPSGQ